MKTAEFVVSLVLLLLLFSSCVRVANAREMDFDEYDEYAEIEVKDPLISYNKVMHNVNDVLLLWVIKPLHKGYSVVIPKTARKGIYNFSQHIKSPLRLVNTVLQFDFVASGLEVSYFFINTCTSLGFADFASEVETKYYYNKSAYNFATTLAVWNVKEGPYIVLPVFGPKTLRSATGTGLDIISNPVSYVLGGLTYTATSAGLQFNNMDRTYVPYEKYKKMTLDPYSGLRDMSLAMERNFVFKHKEAR